MVFPFLFIYFFIFLFFFYFVLLFSCFLLLNPFAQCLLYVYKFGPIERNIKNVQWIHNFLLVSTQGNKTPLPTTLIKSQYLFLAIMFDAVLYATQLSDSSTRNEKNNSKSPIRWRPEKGTNKYDAVSCRRQMEMDWQARQLGLDACSEFLARTILHTPAIYRGANQGGATLIKKESRKKIPDRQKYDLLPRVLCVLRCRPPLSVITSCHFLPLREKPKNSNSTKSNLVDTPKFAEFYYYPQLFFGSEKLTDIWTIGNLASEEAIASASDGGHHDRSGRWFKTAVVKTDRKNE